LDLPQRKGIDGACLELIGIRPPDPGHESASEWIVISGAQIIQAEVWIELFAAIKVVVWCGPCELILFPKAS
jgi:hypothetical protein